MSALDALPESTRVLVVGGGPVGLTASLLLSHRGIPNVVVERRREVQRAPAAHVLRRRPMQVFEQLGVAGAIRRVAPRFALDCITWCATLDGPEAGRLDLRTGLPPDREVWTHCPQNLLEPILLERARSAEDASVVVGVEWVSLEQDAAGVRARVRGDDGREREIAAAWVVAADGAGSPLRRSLGIPMVGPGAQGRFFMVHFEADLRPWLEGRSGPLFWILNPGSPGTLIVHDPAKSHVFMTLRRGGEGEERTLPERLRAALGGATPCRVLSVDAWSPYVQVAERYREGRVLLAGDAAHRFPPTGGLGLNTGILDVDVLVPRIARVEAGQAGAEILDGYELACRPAAQANARESFENMRRLGEIPRVLGPCADLPALERRLGSLGARERRQLARAIERQRSHFLSEGSLPADPGAF